MANQHVQDNQNGFDQLQITEYIYKSNYANADFVEADISIGQAHTYFKQLLEIENVKNQKIEN